MTFKKINNELEKVYQERKSWQGGRGPFDRLSVNQRELVLCKQFILYRLEQAKRLKDKQKELFYLEVYRIIESYEKDWRNQDKRT